MSFKNRSNGFSQLYRINQIQGKSHYGKSFGVNKVLTLNPFKYSEVRVGNIDSNHKSNIFCTHHYSANSEFAAVDFARITSKS